MFIEVSSIRLHQNQSLESHANTCEWTDSHTDTDRQTHRPIRQKY